MEKWNEGVVVLEDHKVIRGTVNVNEKYDVVQIKVGQKIRSIPAWQIENISIYDNELDAVRKYIVLPVKDQTVRTFQFYEIIIRGEVMLLSRDKDYRNSDHPGESLFSKLFPEYINDFANNKDFFFYDGKNLIPLDRFRKVVLPAFKRQFEFEITHYIKEQNLNINYPKDQIRIMKYFNNLYADRSILTKVN
jgi:hypothetical protein